MQREKGERFGISFNRLFCLINMPIGRYLEDAFDMGSLASRKIVVDDHCYGCTAGSGSSCQGQTV